MHRELKLCITLTVTDKKGMYDNAKEFSLIHD